MLTAAMAEDNVQAYMAAAVVSPHMQKNNANHSTN